LAIMKLRDRDAIITGDDIIFRVYGYFHPPNAYVCDPEYASAAIYESTNPRAPRGKRKPSYYKFYADEGLQLVQEKYPQYTVFYEPLQERFVGVPRVHIVKTRKPDEIFRQLARTQTRDDLLKALHDLSRLIMSKSGLSDSDFGVFGSLLHGFYHPSLSDIDLIIYGREKLKKLRSSLEDIYREKSSLRNEFESEKALEGKRWKFVNYTPKEYLRHQRRKMIYAIYKRKKNERTIKAEFEPVKDWKEICNEYDTDTRVSNKGWIKAVARVAEDQDAPFIPSIYTIEVDEILEGPEAENIQRILSYVEEFRMQAERDEFVCVEGNLEEVVTRTKTFHQITLTYCPRYYEQTLKIVR
jgi:predicted nucleotidyltransferase